MMRGLIPSRSNPCDPLPETTIEIQALKSSSSDGIIVTEIIEDEENRGPEDFSQPGHLEPFRTGPSMINLTEQ